MDCALESDRTTEHDRLDGIAPGKLVATAKLSAEMIDRDASRFAASGTTRGYR
jgi:hypothetical protein